MYNITRNIALEWWEKLSNENKYEMCIKQNSLVLKERKPSQLTGRDIENIYLNSKRN